MKAYVRHIESVVEPTDATNLTIVTVHDIISIDQGGNETTLDGPQQVVANKQDDGTPRWKAGEMCIYIPENAIVPRDVLEDRGYWEIGEKKGMLGSSKGNRVKGRTFAKSESNPEGYQSRGLLFKVDVIDGKYVVTRRDKEPLEVEVGDDVASYLELEEFTG